MRWQLDVCRRVHDLILLTAYQMMILFSKPCDNISPALRFTTDKITNWHTSYPSPFRTTGQLQFRVKNVNTFIRYLATLSVGNGDCSLEKSGQGMKPITDLPLVLTLRMSGMIPPLPYMPSSYEQKQLYLYFFNSSNVKHAHHKASTYPGQKSKVQTYILHLCRIQICNPTVGAKNFLNLCSQCDWSVTYTGRFILYSGITKIYYRKPVGHIFTKPVQIEGTTQKIFSQ